MADFLPAGEVPLVGETSALLRFDGVDSAGISIEHAAFVVVFFDQGKPGSVHPQAGILVDKCLCIHAEKSRYFLDFILADSHVTRPFAAGGASLTLIPDIGLLHHTAFDSLRSRDTQPFSHNDSISPESIGSPDGTYGGVVTARKRIKGISSAHDVVARWGAGYSFFGTGCRFFSRNGGSPRRSGGRYGTWSCGDGCGITRCGGQRDCAWSSRCNGLVVSVDLSEEPLPLGARMPIV